MEQIIIYIALILSGLCLGSFAGASVWRLRSKQLVEDKSAGDAVDKAEYSRLASLSKSKITDDRSRCLNCSYVLKWYDLIPIVSWVLLLGKCRNCHKPIGYMEPIVELGVAIFFVISYLLWPFSLINAFEIVRFIIWLISGVGFAVLFIYDKKWFLLPNLVNFLVIGLGIATSILVILGSSNKFDAISSIFGSVLILSGLYFMLYTISKGKWVGFGDIKLGLGLSLLLADWRLAFIALFLSNFIGCLLVTPFLITKKLKRNSHVPFGPLMILGSMLAMLAGRYIIDLYISFLF